MSPFFPFAAFILHGIHCKYNLQFFLWGKRTWGDETDKTGLAKNLPFVFIWGYYLIEKEHSAA
jgi:hypothetical protein